MGYISFFIVIAFWMWVVRKIMDIDQRTKEISNALAEISEKLNNKE